MRWTDDTQMAVTLAEALAQQGSVDCDGLARRWAEQAEWSRGYGPGTLKLLGKIRRGEPWRSASRSVFPEGSWGNGAASPIRAD